MNIEFIQHEGYVIKVDRTNRKAISHRKVSAEGRSVGGTTSDIG